MIGDITRRLLTWLTQQTVLSKPTVDLKTDFGSNCRIVNR